MSPVDSQVLMPVSRNSCVLRHECSLGREQREEHFKIHSY